MPFTGGELRNLNNIIKKRHLDLSEIDAKTFSVEDVVDYFTATTIEGVLAEIYANLSAIGIWDLTSAEVNQLKNIDITTISVAQWEFLGSLNQGLATTDSPTFNVLTLSTPLSNINIADNITLTNITQITNRSHINLTDIGIKTHVEIDTHLGSSGIDHSDVVLNNTHRSSDGSNHTYINQDLQSSATPSFIGVNLSTTRTNATATVRYDQMMSLLNGLDWQKSVLDITTNALAVEILDNRYIASETSGTWTIHYIYEWDGSVWDEIIPNEGYTCWIEDADTNYTFNGTIWVEFGSTISHNNTTGLNGGESGFYGHLTSTQLTNILLKTDSVTDLLDVTGAGSGIIISDAERTNLGNAVTHYGTVIGNPHAVKSTEIDVDILGSPTYSKLQNYIDITQSSGRVSGGVLSDGGSGTINISAGEGFIKTTDSDIGNTLFFGWALKNALALTDLKTNYIYVDYNSGTPQILATIDYSVIEMNRQFPIGMVYRNGNYVWCFTNGMNVVNYLRKTHERLLARNIFERMSGGEISEYGTRNIQSTAGVFYRGDSRVVTESKLSTIDYFTYVYYNGINWQWVNDVTQIDNLQYNDTSTGSLVTLSNNKYGVHWICIDFLSNLYVIYGQGDYTLTEAQNVSVPSTMPVIATEFGIIAAKIIIEKSATSFTEIISAYLTYISSASPSVHNDLAGLQGGVAGEYQHFTTTEHTELTEWLDNIVLGADGKITFMDGSFIDINGLTIASTKNLIFTNGGSVNIINTTFVDNDTSLMTSQAIKEKVESYGYSTTVGTVTNVTGTAPVVSSGGATPNISMVVATAIADGYLDKDDWTIFNSKQGALTFGIADTNKVQIDGNDIANGEYARFTATGLESRTIGEIKADLVLVKADVGLGNVDNIADASQVSVGALVSGSLTAGFTAVVDAQISSASTWNAKVSNPMTANLDGGGYNLSNLGNIILASGKGITIYMSHSLGVGKCVYITGTTVTVCNNTSSTSITHPAIGITTANNYICVSGVVGSLSLTAGLTYYTGTSGGLVTTITQAYVQRVGVAISTTQLLVMPSLDVITT